MYMMFHALLTHGGGSFESPLIFWISPFLVHRKPFLEYKFLIPCEESWLLFSGIYMLPENKNPQTPRSQDSNRPHLANTGPEGVRLIRIFIAVFWGVE